MGDSRVTDDGKEILDRVLASESKAELLMLFHKNPGLIDTVDGVSRRIGKSERLIKSDVEDLVNLGLLRSRTVGKTTVISLGEGRDLEIQKTLVEYFKGL
jgi:predicted transcriptional regulator